MTVPPDTLGERLADVRARVEKAGRPWEEITLVAVTKGLGAEANAEAAALGLLDQGENHSDALAAKASELGAASGIRWHHIGQIQRRSVRAAAGHVVLWHGVDRAEEGEEIARRRPGAAVLVEVNTSGEASKGGCAPSDTPALVDELGAKGLAVQGLMTVGPAADPAGARAAFRSLAALAASLGLPTLSMGMSGDFEIAVQEGATMLRLGTVLFGPRPPVRTHP